MTYTAVINTARLRLLVLTAEQLRLYLVDRGQLGRELTVRFDDAAPATALRRAIGLKLTAMAGAADTAHLWHAYWLIVVQDEGWAAGLAGFKGPPDAAGDVEVGYGIDAGFRRRGYATEAVGALVDWALAAPECLAVTARTQETNEASMAVLRDSDFRQYGSDGDQLLWRINRGNRE